MTDILHSWWQPYLAIPAAAATPTSSGATAYTLKDMLGGRPWWIKPDYYSSTRGRSHERSLGNVSMIRFAPPDLPGWIADA
jgi:hypothetical protein